jgi:Tfp pilus assembly protein PilN
MQRINLLDTLPKRRKDYMCAEVLLPLLIAWALLLFVIYACSWSITARQQIKLKNTLAKRHAITQQLIVLNKNPVGSGKESAGAFLTAQNAEKFSVYLEDLAEATPKGIWLQTISFSNLGKAVLITGNSLSTAFIPEFLHNLSNAKFFVGKNFNVLKVTKLESKEGEQEQKFVSFELGTAQGGVS